jgi:tetratricopeptide (TPR) repeat protein
MRTLWLGVACVAMMPVLAAADTPPATQMTVQQAFEAAEGLSAAGKFEDALAAWTALERRVADRSRNLAIVRLRKARILFLLGRRDEATALVSAGLAALPASDPTLRDDRYVGYMLLGKVAEASLDYATAADSYRRADVIAGKATEHLGAMRGMIETETFTDPDAALADLGRMTPLLADASITKEDRAEMRRVESQLKLNRGDFEGARVAAGDGVKLLGGLTDFTKLDDVAMRSNYAIAALKLGKDEDAREYMAMTGAGRLSGNFFDPAVQMTPPDCGGDGDLRPDDSAVVEFSIGDDGSVILASPIYASRSGVALEFARAVRNWSWTPEQVKALPKFFRYRARVEMRCSTEFTKPALASYADRALVAWLGEKGVEMSPTRDAADAALLPRERAELAALEKAKGGDTLAMVPVLHALSHNRVLARDEVSTLARRESAILTANQAPPMARLSADLTDWEAGRGDSWGGRSWVRRLETAASSAPYADDPEARSILRLMMADAARSFDKDRALALLNQVSAEKMSDVDGLRSGALIRQAAIYAQRGDATAAKAAFDQTGLTARQCSLVDTAPKLLGSSGAFPDEAKHWGFEGWVAVQFDVDADGKTMNQRAVISYPPFIFTKAGDDTLRSARYEKSYRPSGALGCGGITQRVRFYFGRG